MGIGLLFRGKKVIVPPGGHAPTVISINKSLGDASGGTVVQITVDDSTGCIGAAVCGVALTSFSIIDGVTVQGTTSLMSASAIPGDVTVTNSFGASSPLAGVFEAFAPTNISGCIQWLRADLGVTTVGGNTTVWADQSGTGFDMTSASASEPPSIPVGGINSKLAIPFDPSRHSAAGDRLDNISPPVAFSSATALEGFAIAIETNLTTYPQQSFWNYGLGSPGFYSFFGNIYENFGILGRGDTSGNRGPDFPPLPPADSPWLYNARAGVSSLDVYVNGAHVITASGTTIGPGIDTTIGSSAAGVYPLSGSISEVAVYNKILSSGERARFTAYKVDRYAF